MHLRNGDWVVVCDAGKYVVYENQGDTERMDLRVVSFDDHDNPPTHEQGSDKPGRYPGPGGQRAAVGDTDWHEQAEKDFVTGLAAQMDGWATSEPARRFVLVADPRSMGTLRQALNEHTLSRIEHTITGDHVHRPVDAIEALINKA
jgi:protein required for attachment to host cells